MNFANLKEWKTPRGNVVELAIDGVTVWKNGTSIGSLEVGSSVFMNVDGVRTEFLVVHQGLPDATLYDASCDGTWLLIKDLHALMAGDISMGDDYKNSDIHTYINGTFLGMLDSNIQSAIKQVKIPYQDGIGKNTPVSSGVNGLSTKIFLLSCYEVGFTTSDYSYCPVDGAYLSYFSAPLSHMIASKRIGYYNGTAKDWWLRSRRTDLTDTFLYTRNNGYVGDSAYAYSCGVRPALILPLSACVDENFNVIA